MIDGARWTVLAWDPDEVDTSARAWPESGRRMTGPPGRGGGLPFESGCIGWIGYGAAAQVDRFAARTSWWEPDVWLGRYRGAACWRHADGSWHLTGPASLRRDTARAIAEAAPLTPPAPPTGDPPRCTVGRSAWERGVRSALDAIAAGEVYQINLTRALVSDHVGSAWDAWRRLQRAAPAEHGALVVPDDLHRILCNSPELFLDLDSHEVRTRPIKGTRPRHPDASRDARLAHELMDDPKELAELTMIVDLCRNDLGRVAVPGSVRVGRRALSQHVNVHHAAQDVRATLRSGLDAWDLLAATFPPASVTGCPKIRATTWIDALEAAPRGVYCGAIGWASAHGRSQWSVAIRAAVVRGTRARWHVGAGIVADSDPAREWEETEAKGTLLAQALTAAQAPTERPEVALRA